MDIRSITKEDFEQWLPLWDGYNAFYGRQDETALPRALTDLLWQRFFDPAEPVFGLVAADGDHLVGFANYLFHRNTIQAGPSCYLQDLFTDPEARGVGVGRALIDALYEEADKAGAERVYWHTQDTNQAGRHLYDKVANHAGFIVYTRTPQSSST